MAEFKSRPYAEVFPSGTMGDVYKVFKAPLLPYCREQIEDFAVHADEQFGLDRKNHPEVSVMVSGGSNVFQHSEDGWLPVGNASQMIYGELNGFFSHEYENGITALVARLTALDEDLSDEHAGREFEVHILSEGQIGLTGSYLHEVMSPVVGYETPLMATKSEREIFNRYDKAAMAVERWLRTKRGNEIALNEFLSTSITIANKSGMTDLQELVSLINLLMNPAPHPDMPLVMRVSPSGPLPDLHYVDEDGKNCWQTDTDFGDTELDVRAFDLDYGPLFKLTGTIYGFDLDNNLYRCNTDQGNIFVRDGSYDEGAQVTEISGSDS